MKIGIAGNNLYFTLLLYYKDKIPHTTILIRYSWWSSTKTN